MILHEIAYYVSSWWSSKTRPWIEKIVWGFFLVFSSSAPAKCNRATFVLRYGGFRDLSKAKNLTSVADSLVAIHYNWISPFWNVWSLKLSCKCFTSFSQAVSNLCPSYLADQDYLTENIEWCGEHGIRIHHIGMQSSKEPFFDNDPELVAQALALLLDSRNYPILIHSNKGKHRWYLVSALTCTEL